MSRPDGVYRFLASSDRLRKARTQTKGVDTHPQQHSVSAAITATSVRGKPGVGGGGTLQGGSTNGTCTSSAATSGMQYDLGLKVHSLGNHHNSTNVHAIVL